MPEEAKVEEVDATIEEATEITEDAETSAQIEPEPKKARKRKDPVWFESREKEPTAFEVAGIRPIRNFQSGRLEWEVEADDVKRFEQNFFVQRGRVVRKAIPNKA